MSEQNPEDIILWPDDFWCYAYEVHEFSHRSDDYRRIAIDSDEYAQLHAQENPE